MQEPKPPSIEYVQQLVMGELLACDEKQRAVFEQFAVEPYRASITRYGNRETVVVVACNGNEVVYCEEIEEGFNVSPLGPDGTVLEHWCNQDELKLALNYWIAGRVHPEKCGPAKPID